MSILNQSEHLAKFLLRLMVGGLMLFHGLAKLLNLQTLGFIKNQLVEIGMPPVFAYGVFVGEIVAPILILLGIYSRFGGFLIFINMIFAIVLVHMHDILALTEHGGWRLELQVFYLIGGILILMLGSGRYAIKPD